MHRVALVTDSASDITPELAQALDVTVVSLLVYFGDEELRSVDLPPDQFWARMTAPGAPLPRTSACSPADFERTFRTCFEQGAEAIICVTVGGKLSATLKSAQIAAEQLKEREIHVIDSDSASMGEALLLQVAAGLRDAGEPADAIAARVQERVRDLKFYVALETLEYLRRGGRITTAQAAIGSVLSVKPIISIENGTVVQADRVRTRRKARERLLELITSRPIDRLAVLHGMAPDIEGFAAELSARAHLEPDRVTVAAIGPSIGPHVGPGAYGAVCLYRPA
jgi:DegV family protein with EDD domain